MAKLQKDPYSNYVILESTTINSFNPAEKQITKPDFYKNKMLNRHKTNNQTKFLG